jgi:hypothetical protein
MKINVDIERAGTGALNALIQRGNDLRPAFAQIGGYLLRFGWLTIYLCSVQLNKPSNDSLCEDRKERPLLYENEASMTNRCCDYSNV